MKHWCFTFRVEPPENQTVSVRSGGSIMFAAYSRLLGWRLIAGSYEERIPEPEFIYLDAEYARQNPRTSSKHPPRSVDSQFRAGRKKRPVQLALAL